MQNGFLVIAIGENIRSVHAYVTDLKERAAKLQYQKQLLASRVKTKTNISCSAFCNFSTQRSSQKDSYELQFILFVNVDER